MTQFAVPLRVSSQPRSDLARKEFGWVPERDNLDGIVSDALAWERILATKNWPTGTGS